MRSPKDFPNKKDRKVKYRTCIDEGIKPIHARRLRDLGWGAFARWLPAYIEAVHINKEICQLDSLDMQACGDY